VAGEEVHLLLIEPQGTPETGEVALVFKSGLARELNLPPLLK